MDSKNKYILIILFIAIIMSISAVLIYPILFTEKHTVTFHLNNGEDDYVVLVKHESLVSKIDDPIKEGYVFIEWLLEGKTYDFNTPVSEDIYLEAKWQKYEVIDVDNISIVKEITLEKGKTTTLKVDYTPSNATLSTLTWTSSNNNVATINESGLITAKNVGVSTITVTDSLNNSAKCVLTVIRPLESISLSNTNIKIKPGEQKKITVSYVPSDTTEKDILWSSSNASVATVSKDGVIKGISYGTAVITAKAQNGLTASLTVEVDPGQLKLLKDTNFNNGLQLWMDNNEKSYMCANCKNNQYWYIGSWNFPPKFVNSYYENGNYIINADQPNGTNTKLITYNNKGELTLAFNSFGMEYGNSASGWPHLLLDGMLGTSNKQWYFNKYTKLEQKYHSFTNNDIWYHVDVKLNYYTKGNPINGVQALQYLSYIEIHDKEVPSNTIWFGFNLFDDRSGNQQSYTMMDEYTQNYIYHLGTSEIYGSMNKSIYNNGNFIYSNWRSVDVNISNYIDDVVKIINNRNLFGRNITKDDLYIGAVNIGFEIHGEYHASISMKNLQITSISK